MTRWFAILGCVTAFALAAPMSFDAEAGHLKRCKGVSIHGKTTTFVCKAKTKCCYDRIFDKGSCGHHRICL